MKRFAAEFAPGILPGIAWLLAVFTIGALPLLVVPAATDSFILSKQILFQCTTCVLAGLAIAAAICGFPLKIHLQPVNGFVMLLLLWTGISIAWSSSPTLAREEFFRQAMLVAFFFLFQSLCLSRRQLINAAFAASASSLVISAWVVLTDFRRAFSPNSLPVRQVLGDWRDAISTAALGNTSHIGDFLVFGFLAWCGILILARAPWMSWIAVVSLALHAAALIVAWSVHSNASLIAAAPFMVFLLRDYGITRRFKGMKRHLVVLCIAWLAIVAFYSIDHPLNPHGSAIWARDGHAHGGIFSEALGSPRWTNGLDTREAIWLTTLEIIHSHPWLGVGAGNFVYTYPATISALVQSNPNLASYGSSWTNAAHNEILQTWSDLGIVGLAMLVIMIGAAMLAYRERLKSGTSFGNAVMLATAFAALVALCLQMQMNFPLRLPVSSMFFLLLLAVPHLVPPRSGDEPALLVPVERTWGPLTAGIILKNMAFPTTISFHLTLPRILSGAMGALIVSASVAEMVPLSRPLRADILYREVYEDRQISGLNPSLLRPPLARSQQVLAIWPGHINCRSGYQQMLLDSKDYNAVVAQTPLVLLKLNATEVYQRRAVALEALGRAKEAASDWDEVFRRQPGFGAAYPAPFNEWLQREKSRSSPQK